MDLGLAVRKIRLSRIQGKDLERLAAVSISDRLYDSYGLRQLFCTKITFCTPNMTFQSDVIFFLKFVV